VKRATEALVQEAQSRTRDVSQNDDVDAAAVATPASASASKMVSGMAQVSWLHAYVCIYRFVCLFLSLEHAVKLKNRNNLLMKLGGSSWGAIGETL